MIINLIRVEIRIDTKYEDMKLTEPKAQAPVQRRTNWKASDLGKGTTMNEVN